MSDLIDSSSTDLSKLKVADLKKELKSKGLSTNGNKNELIERLKDSLTNNDLDIADAKSDVLADSAILDEDVLNDDELEDKEDVDTTPPIENTITLKRTHDMIEEKHEETDIKDNTVEVETTVEKLTSEEPRKIIKLGSYSDKERLEMRAKKFGTQLPSDMKKELRAQRFGLNNSKSIAKSEDATLEVLKKRAERFGSSVSKKLSEAEAKEKLEKRKERFGSIQNTNVTTSSTDVKIKPTMTNAEKAQLRLKRFNMGVK
ncbi:SAP domain-containing ribonucleoprotein-like [Ctenocephalides felis]|uniref:SAP domain-containing ribonucleoprotein-like n=1 Tax=Ctenocephalides felis TaxID=7515 RepID=UPI000E6E4173|nr:SAP domain-containing ribonucleoprotein-like [Ctenocephalides felis]